MGAVMGTPKYLWLCVTADEYELPLAVADTARELGKMVGLSRNTIEVCAYRGISGSQKGRRYIKVPREE
jgi:hypothetical protein